jgi:high affinity Mn2+ porin
MIPVRAWIPLLLVGTSLLPGEDTTAPPAPASARPEPIPAPAPSAPAPLPPEDQELATTLRAQGTVIIQKHNDFHSPYAGANSVPADEGRKTSFTGTLFAGVRLGPDTEVYLDPEVAGGEGFGGVIGIAGFPNGDIARVGTSSPEPYVARLFLRQTLNLAADREVVADGVNQVAMRRSRDRLVLSVGKVSASDAFDNNAYSHDPRTQFMNWSLMSNGAWDYAADSRGYTVGGILEYFHHDFALRYAMFQLPSESNGAVLDSHIRRALEYVAEGEQHWAIASRPGALRLLVFDNREHMGSYRKALELTPSGGTPDITAARSDSAKYGFGVNMEQALTADLGAFARFGWNDGHTETWAFAEIDRTLSAGVQLQGARWRRPLDVIGVAAVANGISRSHQDYLAAGGEGFFLGDGRLHYGFEKIIEAYYAVQMDKNLTITPDLQYIDNPAYNRDRGPIEVWGIRAHADF